MQQQKTSSTSFSSQQQQQSFMQSQQQNQQQRTALPQQPQQPQTTAIKHGEEIQQESLKTTLQSAITDLEQDIDKNVVDNNGDKENQAPIQQQQQQVSRSYIS